jgi:hypothetical protein
LCPDADPLAFLANLLARYPFPSLYIADPDAIEECARRQKGAKKAKFYILTSDGTSNFRALAFARPDDPLLLMVDHHGDGAVALAGAEFVHTEM